MFWIGMAVVAVVGIVGLMVAILVNRRPDVGQLGPVSERWIAEHRVDWP
jgi:hypothetical protein